MEVTCIQTWSFKTLTFMAYGYIFYSKMSVVNVGFGQISELVCVHHILYYIIIICSSLLSAPLFLFGGFQWRAECLC